MTASAIRGSRSRLVGQRRPIGAVDDDLVAVERVPDDGLARRAVGVDRGDGREAEVVEEGADAVGEGAGHALDGTRARRPATSRTGLGRPGATSGARPGRGQAALEDVDPSGRHRLRRGPPEQVALAELDAERRQRREVGPPLDALGEQVRADPPPERDERLDERLLGVVVADPVDDRRGRS